MPGKSWIALGIILAGFSVAFGAFGAHGLERYLSQVDSVEQSKRIEIWKTGAMYHYFHAVGIVLVGFAKLILGKTSRHKYDWAAGLMLVGVILFSGSLYAISLFQIRAGLIVPIGGLAFLLGWLMFAVAVLGSWSPEANPPETTPEESNSKAG